MDKKIETQKYIVNRLDNYIESSQNKSNLYLALNTIVLGGIITLISSRTESFTCILNLILGIIALLAFTSIIITLKVISPYLKSNQEKKSIFFFHDISSVKQGDYYKTISEQSEEDLLRDLSEQTHTIAKGLNIKYSNLILIGWIIGVEFLLLFIWIITYLNIKN